MSEPNTGGRPTAYTPELATAICEQIADGLSLRQICVKDGMPSQSMVFRWLAQPDRVGFREQYARAREAQADKLADEILEIADETEGDFIGKELGDGTVVEVVDHEHIQRSKLRVDARKWKAAKLAPKKYGDRVINEHGGLDGEPVKIETIRRIIVDPKQPAGHSDSPGVPAFAWPGKV